MATRTGEVQDGENMVVIEQSENGTTYEINDPQVLDSTYQVAKTVLTAVYGIMSISIIFHLFVIVSLIHILALGKCRDIVHNCIYALALTTVDAIVIIHLPFLLAEIVQQQWTFGLAWCRFFWVAESVNKLLSTFLLMAICFDRYIAVCYPLRAATGTLRLPRMTCIIIAVCTVTASILLSPMYTNAALDNFEIAENHTIVKCVVKWSEELEQYFTIMIFLVGYCAPLLLMAFFYSRIIISLRKRASVFSASCTGMDGTSVARERRLKAVTKRSFALVLVYFLCWTPFWVISFNVRGDGEPGNLLVTTFYFMHALVYLNSAINPVLYVILNSKLRSYLNFNFIINRFVNSYEQRGFIRATKFAITEDVEATAV